MNKLKRLSILLCALVVLCIATFVLTQYEEEKEIIKNSDEIILQVNPEEVVSLSWSYAAQDEENPDDDNLSFHRSEDGTWLWDGDDAFPVDDEVMTDYLEKFREFGAAFVIEEVTDYSQYGLAQPECTIHFATADTEYTVTLGDFSKMDSQRYVSIGDGNAYLVSTDPLEDFQVTIRDMIDNDEVTRFDQATKIKFEGLAGYSVNYEEESSKSYCADDVYFTGNLPLDTDLVEDYLDEIQGLSLSNYATYNANEEELKSFGMDAPELTVTVDYTIEAKDEDTDEKEGTLTVYVSRDPVAAAEAKAAEAALEEDPEADVEEVTPSCYVRIGQSPIVYEISESLYDTLVNVSYNELRHKELIPVDFEDVTQVDITLGGEVYTMTTILEVEGEDGETEVVEAEDDEIHWYFDGEEIDMASFESAVFNLFADEFTEEEPSDIEEIAATFHLKHENFPTVTIQLYRYDGSSCLAVVDGESVALIDRTYAVDLIESVLAIVLN